MVTFEENIDKQEINLHGLAQRNEVIKTIKFDVNGVKVSFDMAIRVKQAYRKEEMETKTVTSVKLGKIHMPFDVFESREPKPQPSAKQPQA